RGPVLKRPGMSPAAASLADLTARHRNEIVAYLVRLLGDRQEAEDACQDAFLRAHRAFARLGADANSRAWLYRIASRSALNALRRRSRRAARAAGRDPHPPPAHPPGRPPPPGQPPAHPPRGAQPPPA